MLTGELVRTRRQGELVVPRYLDKAARVRLLPVATELVAVLAASHGQKRAHIEAALDAVACRPADRPIVLGLRKLLLDRAELAPEPGLDPELVRARLFGAAARVRRELAPLEPFVRERVVAGVAAELGLAPEALEARLFADLRQNERLVGLRPLAPEALLFRYDLALAQGVLVHSTRVALDFAGEQPEAVRGLFRAARFHGLLHQIVGDEARGYRLEVDGPLSLFGAVQRYGLALALFLPSVLRLGHFELLAELRWGLRKERALFRLTPKDGLAAPGAGAARGASEPRRLAPHLEELCRRFVALGSAWTVEPAERVIALPGERVCVPDLVFRRAAAPGAPAAEIYLEAFGFWSRQAVWQRLEAVERGLPCKLLLAVGKQLRVSEDLLDDSDRAALYVYRESLLPKAVLAKLDGLAGSG
ncbi:MAG: DUF790 family protein [Myxococcales bacterium]|nr:DUF790 family protein [Myxococcales bacterium]